jgi:hypothetical protein
MTGSAFTAMDVVVACFSVEKGGGLEEGGLEIDPDRRDADFVLGVFFVFCLAPFLEAPFSRFFSFLGAFWIPRVVIFGAFTQRNCIIRKNGHPRFLHTFIAFWLDFQGLGPPGWLQKREKTAPRKSCFLECF